MKISVKAGCAALCALMIGVAVADAQTPTSTPPAASYLVPYKALLDQGFEVKNVYLLPAEVGTRVANNTQPDSVVVTLQKGPVTAVCWITANSWNNQDIGSVNCSTVH
jgi:hypothetical protein